MTCHSKFFNGKYPELRTASEDGRITGSVRSTPFTRLAILITPTRRQEKRFRGKGYDNEFLARKWLDQQIKLYYDMKAKRGEFHEGPPIVATTSHPIESPQEEGTEVASLKDAAVMIGKIRRDLLFNCSLWKKDGKTQVDRFAEQHYNSEAPP